MIYRFAGIPESNEIRLMDNNKLFALCLKGQVLVDTKSDYKNCDITNLEGQEVQIGKWSGFMFIPEQDTEEFIRTREYDFKKLAKKKLQYVE